MKVKWYRLIIITVGGLVNTSPADIMLPKAAIVTLKGLLAWSNFISALDIGIKAHCIILLRTRNDPVFQLADYLGMRWLLLIYPLYIWLIGSKFTCDRLRKKGITEQVAIIYAASDPTGNDANTLCSRAINNKNCCKSFRLFFNTINQTKRTNNAEMNSDVGGFV